jgi:hypothetical protein
LFVRYVAPLYERKGWLHRSVWQAAKAEASQKESAAALGAIRSTTRAGATAGVQKAHSKSKWRQE